MNTANAAAKLASVVFLKIQEFARRSAQEQARLRAQLDAVIAVTTADLDPAGWIALDAADGAAIAVLADPEGALRLARRSLSAAAGGLPLCIGINHGAVQVTKGGRGPDGMTGDGIAVAASVSEFAASTRVLISRSFRDALAEASPALDAGLSPAGVFTDAGLRTHELFFPDKSAATRRQRRLIAANSLESAAPNRYPGITGGLHPPVASQLNAVSDAFTASNHGVCRSTQGADNVRTIEIPPSLSFVPGEPFGFFSIGGLVSEMAGDWRLPLDTAIRVRAFHQWLSDVIDEVPIVADGVEIDAPGNIGGQVLLAAAVQPPDRHPFQGGPTIGSIPLFPCRKFSSHHSSRFQ